MHNCAMKVKSPFEDGEHVKSARVENKTKSTKFAAIGCLHLPALQYGEAG